MSVGNVLVLGAASWNRMVYVDDLPQGVSATIMQAREVENAGSTGVGKAMALAALGCNPTLQCTLGRDENGARVRAACETRGIRLIVDEQSDATPHHLNIMDQAGGRYSFILWNGPDKPVIDRDRLRKEIQSAETIFLSLCPSSKAVLPLLAETRAEVLLDLHDYDGQSPWHADFLAYADVVQVSDVALDDPDSVIARLLAGRARQVVITKAERGAEIVTAQGQTTVPPCPANLKDSNGAGDAFSVALWLEQLSGLTIAEAGRFAAAAAAFALESSALFPPDITAEDIRHRAGKL